MSIGVSTSTKSWLPSAANRSADRRSAAEILLPRPVRRSGNGDVYVWSHQPLLGHLSEMGAVRYKDFDSRFSDFYSTCR